MINLICLRENRGKGYAIKKGLMNANNDKIVIYDGDMELAPSDISRLMILDKEIAKQLAKSLLQINAIILQPENPFTWASGWKSPIYCDNRRTLSFPEVRTFIRQNLARAITTHFKGANLIAGVATGGIPHGVLVSEELGLPCGKLPRRQCGINA